MSQEIPLPLSHTKRRRGQVDESIELLEEAYNKKVEALWTDSSQVWDGSSPMNVEYLGELMQMYSNGPIRLLSGCDVNSSNGAAYARMQDSVGVSLLTKIKCPPPLVVLTEEFEDSHGQFASIMCDVGTIGGVDEYLLSKLQNAGKDQWIHAAARERKASHCAVKPKKDYVHDAMMDSFEGKTSESNLSIAASFIASKAGKELYNSQVSTSNYGGHGDAKVNQSLTDHSLLGKRGRIYYEIDNEDLYFSYSKQHHFSALDDWSNIFNSYNDNHDGFYRNWFLGNLETIKCGGNNKSYRKIPTASLGVSTNDCQALKLRNAKPPPVPVALQHPACWGINSRIQLTEGSPNYASRYEMFHPACHSNTVVLPPAAQTRTGSADDAHEDVDEMNIYAKRLADQLDLVEADIYLQLHNLQSLAKRAAGVDALRQRRIQLSNALYQSYGANDPKTSERVTYPFRPATADDKSEPSIYSLSQELRHNLSSDLNNEGGGSRYTTRQLSKSASQKHTPQCNTLAKRQLLVGACLESDVSYGDMMHSLRTGDFIQAVKGGRWVLCQITRLKYDRSLLRYIKVGQLNSHPMNAWWVAVEDGLIAPLPESDDGDPRATPSMLKLGDVQSALRPTQIAALDAQRARWRESQAQHSRVHEELRALKDEIKKSLPLEHRHSPEIGVGDRAKAAKDGKESNVRRPDSSVVEVGGSCIGSSRAQSKPKGSVASMTLLSSARLTPHSLNKVAGISPPPSQATTNSTRGKGSDDFQIYDLLETNDEHNQPSSVAESPPTVAERCSSKQSLQPLNSVGNTTMASPNYQLPDLSKLINFFRDGRAASALSSNGSGGSNAIRAVEGLAVEKPCLLIPTDPRSRKTNPVHDKHIENLLNSLNKTPPSGSANPSNAVPLQPSLPSPAQSGSSGRLGIAPNGQQTNMFRQNLSLMTHRLLPASRSHYAAPSMAMGSNASGHVKALVVSTPTATTNHLQQESLLPFGSAAPNPLLGALEKRNGYVNNAGNISYAVTGQWMPYSSPQQEQYALGINPRPAASVGLPIPPLASAALANGANSGGQSYPYGFEASSPDSATYLLRTSHSD